MRRRGQIVSLDLYFAGAIFILALAIILVNWNNLAVKLENKVEFDTTQNVALRLSDVLVKTSGTPDDWGVANVIRIGLAANDRNLSTSKIDNLLNLNYNITKELLNINNYDFNLNVSDKTYGIKEPKDVDMVGVKRIVMYEDQVNDLLIKIWKR